MMEYECLNCGNVFESKYSAPLGPTCPECGHPSRDPKCAVSVFSGP